MLHIPTQLGANSFQAAQLTLAAVRPLNRVAWISWAGGGTGMEFFGHPHGKILAPSSMLSFQFLSTPSICK